MNEYALTFGGVEQKIITLRDEEVILDSDLALLYGVETKAINQAVKNNPDKFPPGYVWELTREETECSRSKILTLNDRGRRESNIKCQVTWISTSTISEQR